MAKEASMCLFLYFLFVHIVSSSGTLVGFLFDARKSNAIPSVTETITFLKINKFLPSHIRVLVSDHRVLDTLSNTSVPIDLYINKTLAQNLRKNKPTAIWLKTLFLNNHPHVKMKNIIVSGSGSSSKELPMLLSTLKFIHSMLCSYNLDRELKVSLSLPLSFLENSNSNPKHEKELIKVLNFINKTRSSVIVEANINGELSMGDPFVESAINKATMAISVLPRNVSMVLNIKSSVIPSAQELTEFNGKISRGLENMSENLEKKIIGLFVEVSTLKDFEKKELNREEKQIFHSSHRELLNNFQTTKHDNLVYPPTTTFPTTPVTNPVTTPVTFPPDNPAPTIVTISPNPPSNPVPLPETDPNSPFPITNPVTTPSTNPGAQPITNPVTTYPTPSTGVPVTTPVTPPETANSPAVPGQSWCVAKSGALQTALQSALDYACGIGGADCSTIQQSGSCYNPNTLQNHASYAFNSYYQKNPGPTSCNFGGTALITNINPSTGSCIYPSSSSSSTTPVSPIQTSPTPTPTTSASSGAAVPGSVSPPSAINGSNNPASGSPAGFGENPPIVFGDSPPTANTTTSMSTHLQPFIGCIVVVTSIIAAKLVLNM